MFCSGACAVLLEVGLNATLLSVLKVTFIGAGARPRAVGALPAQLAALNRTFLNAVELTVRAALDGSREHVYQAALLDPNAGATLTTTQIVAMCDDLLDAHKALLPPGLTR
jgi:alpha-galactosidase